MKKTVTTLALVLLTLCLQSCSPAPREYHQDFYVFGTLVGVTVWDSDDTRAYAAFNELQQRFQGMHRDWHAWEPGMLTGINDAFARGQAAMANEDILLMIRRAQAYESASGGRFNATIGGLIPLWLGGGPMWEPMAIAIIFGLLFATVLTLGVVPILYSLMFRVRF